MKHVKNPFVKKPSLRVKTAFFVALFSVITAIILTVSLCFLYAVNYKNDTLSELSSLASALSDSIDGTDIETYSAAFEQSPILPDDLIDSYEKYRNEIYNFAKHLLKSDDDDADIYVIRFCSSGLLYLFDSGSDGTNYSGEIHPYGEDDWDFLKNHADYEDGNGCTRMSKNYGLMYCAAMPVKNVDGTVVAYVLCETTAKSLYHDIAGIMLVIAVVVLIVSAALLIVYLIFINKSMVTPIKKLSDAVKNFVSHDESGMHLGTLDSIEINTGDEIETLYGSALKMKYDIENYIENIKTMTSERERMRSELKIAASIQSSANSNDGALFKDKTDFDVGAFILPAKEVGGDFYDCFDIDGDRAAFLAADVSGKGVPAALYMMKAKSLIKLCAVKGGSLKTAMEFVNGQLCDDNSAGIFVTLWLGIYSRKTGTLTYVNAGHNYPYLCTANGEFKPLKERSGLFLGALNGVKYKEFSLQLSAGDTLFLYTDGVNEANNSDGEQYGEKRLKAALDGARGCTSDEIISAVRGSVSEFCGGAAQFDDMTMLCFKVSKCEFSAEPTRENLPKFLSFAEQALIKHGVPKKDLRKLNIITDEICTNVTSYSGAKELSVRVDVSLSGTVSLTFADNGKPFNPQSVLTPDTQTPLSERKTGGMGIFIVNNLADQCRYEYKNGKNIFTVEMNFSRSRAD